MPKVTSAPARRVSFDTLLADAQARALVLHAPHAFEEQSKERYEDQEHHPVIDEQEDDLPDISQLSSDDLNLFACSSPEVISRVVRSQHRR